MRQAGCRRIFIGIESGSQKVLDWMKKGYRTGEMAAKIRLVHKAGIESLGFFIVGSPPETQQDFEQSIALAKASKLDYVVVSRLLAYPGTEMFRKMRGQIDFSLFPYKNRFKDASMEEKWLALERKFYRSFYLRPAYIAGRLSALVHNPKELLSNAKMFLSYLLESPGKERQDMF